MTSNIIQTLINTRIEHEVEEIEPWVARLTTLSEETDDTRKVDPSLLTSNEAEVLVRYYGTQQTRQEVADAMDLSPNRIDNLRYAAEEDLLAAETTLAIIRGMRTDVRPDLSDYQPADEDPDS